MTTIRAERFEVKTIWSDGSTSTEHCDSRPKALDLANSRRGRADVSEVVINPIMKTISHDWWLPA